VKVIRAKGMKGSVKIECQLPAHVRGIQVDPMTIAADGTSGELSFRFSSEAKSIAKLRVVVRATIQEKGEPVTAEMTLALVTGQ
jgi:hypothetical protein